MVKKRKNETFLILQNAILSFPNIRIHLRSQYISCSYNYNSDFCLLCLLKKINFKESI